MMPPINPPREDANSEELTRWVRQFTEQYNMLLDMLVGGLRSSGDMTQKDPSKRYNDLQKAQFLAARPVGSYYASQDPTSPEILFGGKWEPFRGGFLYAEDDEHPAGSTGGEEKHMLTVEEMPSHYHGATYTHTGEAAHNLAWFNTTGTSMAYQANYVGGNQPHNNMPPYHADYVWVRIA